MKTRAIITIIAATVIALWTCGNVQAEPPDVTYRWPTPDDGATVTEPTVQIEAAIAEIDLPQLLDLTEATFQWDGVDYTLYDSSLVLMFNFNNVTGLGEDYTLTPELGVRDISLYGNDGHLGILGSGPPVTGVPDWAESDGFGGCFNFNASTGESILVPHNPSLNPGAGDFTIAFWILPVENVDSDIMRKGSTYTSNDTWYKVEHSVNSDNKISLNFNTNGTDATIYSTDSYADYSWHFVVAQRRGDQAELWIDGVLNGTAAVTGEIYNEANLTLGSKDTQDDDFFSGMLDEVRIYMKSFSADGVQMLYDSMLGIYPLEPTKWVLDVTRSGLESGDYTYAVSATNALSETYSNQRTVTVALPAPPDVTLVSPANGSVLNDTSVTFTVSATDPVGLASATLYIGTPEEVATFSGPADTDDAQISADSPNTTYGSATSINVDGLTPHAHAVIKFTNLIGSGPGQVPLDTTIVSATLQVNCTNYGAMMQVYRLTSDWAEDTVTWNSPWVSPAGDYDPATVVNGDCTATGLRTIDVTEFVQAWSDGISNYGIILTDSGGTDGIDFDSSESGNPPLLTVVYAGDWQAVDTQEMWGTSGTAIFTDVPLNDMTDYVWNCLVTNAGNPPMSSWAPDNFNLSIDGQTPDEPVLVGPAEGATGVPIPATLEVTVSDPQTEDVLDVTFYGRKKVSGADDFMIVVLPDTQKYVLNEAYPEIFTIQTQWIVDNLATSNIVFVTHEGDIVDTWNNTTEWGHANNSMSLLNGVVPYGVLPGNHDQPTTYYNQYFPYTRYEGETWYGGHYPTTGNDNSYQLFSAGGVDFVILHLQYNPGTTIADPVIAWADGMLKSYPDRIAIITTHAYLETTGTLLGEGSGIWNVLVQGNDNVYLVLCGHRHGEARRTDVVNGREVHQVLADYQSRANGGDGWLRTMRFVPAENKIYVETYSPYRDEYETDTDSQFELDVPLNWFTEIGTNLDVANGSDTSVAWTDLAEQSEYEWYVTVTDSTDRTSVGPVWSFTSAMANQPPTANDDTATTDEDTPITIDVLANDSDPESDPFAVDSVTQPSNGTVVNNGTDVTYTPDDNFNGVDTFTYTAADATSASEPATVTVTVNPINDAPVANDQTVSVKESTLKAITLTGSDVDEDPLTYYVVDFPVNGLLTGTEPDLTYTPNPGYTGPDSFTFKANDSVIDSKLATVTITVNANNAPVANPDNYSIEEDGTLNVDAAAGVLFNDTDADGDSLTAIPVSGVTQGVLTLNSDGSFTYSPAVNVNGSDSFTYIANDGTADSAPTTVSITITSVNDDPVANDDTATTDEDTGTTIDVLANDSDADGDSLSVTSVTQPTNGTIVNNGTDVTYTPNTNFFGSDSFTYMAGDGNGGSASATVNVTVNSINDPPTANDDSASTLRDVPVHIDVLSNDDDIEGSTLSVDSVTQPTNGSVVNNGANVTYTPSPGYVGGDSFTYTANDGTANGNTATVTVTVTAPGPTTLFSDGFESGGLAAGGWTSSGSVDVKEPAAYEGLYGVQIGGTASIVKSVSTVGFADIHVKYARNTKGLDPGESLTVEWSADGTAWNVIEPTQDTAWAQRDIALGPAASENAAFSLRFRTNADKTNEYASVDTVEITGATAGPDLSAPIPNPMTWAPPPYATGTTSISMTATTAADASGVEYSFVCTAGGGHDSGWQAAPTYTDTGLTPGIEYTYQVKARDKSPNLNETGWSSPATAMPVDVPPAAPTGLTASPGDGQVSLDWNDNSESDLAGYNVYRSTTPGSGYVKVNGTLLSSSNYLDSSLTNGTTYYYVVAAVDTGSNQSGYSSEVSATPGSVGAVFVSSIVERPFVPAGKNVKAVAGVTISPAESGGIVTGDWYLNEAILQTGASGTTDAAGYTEISSPPVKTKAGDGFRFVVTNVTLTGYTYDPGQNVVSEIYITYP